MCGYVPVIRQSNQQTKTEEPTALHVLSLNATTERGCNMTKREPIKLDETPCPECGERIEDAFIRHHAARIIGSMTSERKAESSAANGKRSMGRPRKQTTKGETAGKIYWEKGHLQNQQQRTRRII